MRVPVQELLTLVVRNPKHPLGLYRYFFIVKVSAICLGAQVVRRAKRAAAGNPAAAPSTSARSLLGGQPPHLPAKVSTHNCRWG